MAFFGKEKLHESCNVTLQASLTCEKEMTSFKNGYDVSQCKNCRFQVVAYATQDSFLDANKVMRRNSVRVRSSKE